MALDVDRIEDRYVAEASPPQADRVWSSPAPLTVEEVTKGLRQVGVHLRDIVEAITAADEDHAAGRTDRVRYFRSVRYRIEHGEAEPGDVEIVRRELLDEGSNIYKGWLIGMLMLAPYDAASEAVVLERLQHSRNEGELEIGLRALAGWSPTSYQRAAVDFIKGTHEGAVQHVREWAITYAGVLLHDGSAPALLDELVVVASDLTENPSVSRAARGAIAKAAHVEQADNITFFGNDEELRSLIADARRRLGTR